MTGVVQDERSGGDLLVDALLEHGIDRIFGLPGIQLDPFFDAVARRGAPEIIGVRHEQAVSYLADGYSRSASRPGVGVVVPGPGMLNALAGISTAYACESKVLLIVGQIDSALVGTGIGALHEIPDQSGILRSLTRWHACATNTADIPGLIADALSALDTIGGPAALEVPVDILEAVVSLSTTTTTLPAPAAAAPFAYSAHDAAIFEHGLAQIAGASRPVIVAGGGCARNVPQELLTRFAESIGAPVVCSENGKGTIDARHPLAFERSGYRALIEDADLVIALGTRFASSQARNLPIGNAQLFAVNSDPIAAARLSEIGVTLQGRAEHFLEQALARTGDAAGSASAVPARSAELAAIREGVEAAVAQIAPQMEYVDHIRRLLPAGGRVVGEYTQLGYAASYAYPCQFPGELIWPGYQGTLGYGFATALGAAFGQDAPVVCVTGDGGFSWTMEELSTLKQYRPRLITVVVNDGHYGNVRRIQKQRYEGREIASSLTNPDYQQLAAAFAIPADMVNTPDAFAEALERRLNEDGPSLIEIQVGEFPSSWHLNYPA